MICNSIFKKITFQGEDCINKLAENISHNEDSPFTIIDLRDIRYKVNDQFFCQVKKKFVKLKKLCQVKKI